MIDEPAGEPEVDVGGQVIDPFGNRLGLPAVARAPPVLFDIELGAAHGLLEGPAPGSRLDQERRFRYGKRGHAGCDWSVTKFDAVHADKFAGLDAA